jgi:hypothetical protein
VPGATSYLVKVGKKSTSSPSTRFTLKRLKPRKAYRIQIIAVNSAGSSDPVNVRIKKAKKK